MASCVRRLSLSVVLKVRPRPGAPAPPLFAWPSDLPRVDGHILSTHLLMERYCHPNAFGTSFPVVYTARRGRGVRWAWAGVRFRPSCRSPLGEVSAGDVRPRRGPNTAASFRCSSHGAFGRQSWRPAAWAARCWGTGASGAPRGRRGLGAPPRCPGPQGPRESVPPAKGVPPACRDGNASVLVRFRLHFLLWALRSLDLGLERELLQQGLRARLQGHGIPLAAHGTLVSATLTGE